MENKTNTSWGGVSDWYDELLEGEDTYQKRVILPNILRLLEIRKGLRILDLSCGQGFFTREFFRNGASVLGSDISPELINIAIEKSPKEIEYKVAPSDDLHSLKDGSFDAVSIVLALQNIENLNGTISEVSRILKKGGIFVAVINHPAFRIPKRSSWGFDEKGNVQYRRVDEYMSESRSEIDMEPGKLGGQKTVSFHRPLQVYFKSFEKNGMIVKRLEEWVSHKQSEKGPRQSAENKSRKEFPMFMCLVVEKR